MRSLERLLFRGLATVGTVAMLLLLLCIIITTTSNEEFPMAGHGATNRMTFLRAVEASSSPSQDGGKRPNVVLALFDDLNIPIRGYLTNPEHHPFAGSPGYTPNINKIVQQGMVFENAYATMTTSAPARSALLTAVSPLRMQLFNDGASLAESTSWKRNQRSLLHREMRSAGYQTFGTGKILAKAVESGSLLNLNHWVSLESGGTSPRGPQAKVCPSVQFPDDFKTWESCSQLDEDELVDDRAADEAVSFIRSVATSSDPFFMTVGFYRPSGAFSTPSWVNEVFSPLFGPMTAAVDAAGDLMRTPPSQGELGTVPAWTTVNPRPNHDEMLSVTEVGSLKFGHALSAHWADFTFGRITAELKRIGQFNNTIFVLTTDHAVSLGERSDVGGNSGFEVNTRIPLIISVPEFPKSMGKRTRSMVANTDIGVTIFDLATGNRGGWSTAGSDRIALDGKSFVNVFQVASIDADPGDSALLEQISTNRVAVYTFVSRCLLSDSENNDDAEFGACDDQSDAQRVDMMGISMRIAEWRYVEWRAVSQNSNTKEVEIKWNTESLWGRELYDHNANQGSASVDGARYELFNVAPCNSCQPKRRRRLQQRNSDSVDHEAVNRSTGSNRRITQDSDSGYRLPGDSSGENYQVPDLDAIETDQGREMVKSLSVNMRSAIRDGEMLCSDKGVFNPVTEQCSCMAGWFGRECQVSTIPGLDGSPTPSPITDPPSPLRLQTKSPVGAPTFHHGRIRTPNPTPTSIAFTTRSPTFKWPDTVSPTPEPTPEPTPSCALTKPDCMRRQEYCWWDPSRGHCRRNSALWTDSPTAPSRSPVVLPTASPSRDPPPSPQPKENFPSCKSLRVKNSCQRMRGCMWRSDSIGCIAPRPYPCGCQDIVNPVMGYMDGRLFQFRSECIANCKGATQIQPVGKPGEDTPPPTGSEADTSSLDLYFVVDLSASVNRFNRICQQNAGESCLELLTDFIGSTSLELSAYFEGFTKDTGSGKGLRVSIIGYSCDGDGKDIAYPLLRPSGHSEAIDNALEKLANMKPDGGRCPVSALNQALSEIQSTGSKRANYAVVLFTNGFFNGFGEISNVMQKIRRQRVGTFISAVALRRRNGVGLTRGNLRKQRRQLNDLAGTPSRVHNAANKGYEGLTGTIDDLVADIMDHIYDPSKITSGQNSGSDSQGLSEGAVAAVSIMMVLVMFVVLPFVTAFIYMRKNDMDYNKGNLRKVGYWAMQGLYNAPDRIMEGLVSVQLSVSDGVSWMAQKDNSSSTSYSSSSINNNSSGLPLSRPPSIGEAISPTDADGPSGGTRSQKHGQKSSA